MNGLNPEKWLESLHSAISGVKCKVEKKPVSYDEAADAVSRTFAFARTEKRSVWWIGNGGSAAICSHLSQDLTNKLDIRSFYLGDASLMTCMANDFGYKNVYAIPLSKMAVQNDLLVAISSSGNSDNIVTSVETALEKGMEVITLSGFTPDNKLWQTCSGISFLVEADLYGLVEVSHEALLHGIIETLWLSEKGAGL